MSSISATIDGESVDIVSIQQNGLDVYLAYIDTSGNYKVKRKFRDPRTETPITIGTSAVYNSSGGSGVTDHTLLTNIGVYTHAEIDSVLVGIISTSSTWSSAYSHVSSDGSSHSFIDQSVTTSATPKFVGISATTISADTYVGITSANFTNFEENVQDIIYQTLSAGPNIALVYDDNNNLLQISGSNSVSATLANIATYSTTTASQTFSLDANTYFVIADTSGTKLMNIDESTGIAAINEKKILGEQVVWGVSISDANTEKVLSAGVPYYSIQPLLGATHLTSVSVYITQLAAGTINMDIGIYEYSKDGDLTKKANKTVTPVTTGFYKVSFDDYVTFTDSDDHYFIGILFDNGTNTVLVKDNTPLLMDLSCRSAGTGLTALPESELGGDRIATDFQIYFEPRIGELEQVYQPDVAWTPLDDTNLLAWWDPNDATTLSAGDSPTDIYSITDKKNGNEIYRSTGYAQPTPYDLDGVTFIDYDGNDNLGGTISFPSSGNVSFYMTFLVNTINDLDESIFAFQGSHDFEVRADNASQFDGAIQSTMATKLSFAGGPYSDSVVRILSLVFSWDDGTIKAYIDGTLVGSVADYNANKLSVSQEIRVMAGTAGDVIGGAAHCDFVITESIDDATRQKIEGYLVHKVGKQASLPSGHPYKRVIPGV